MCHHPCQALAWQLFGELRAGGGHGHPGISAGRDPQQHIRGLEDQGVSGEGNLGFPLRGLMWLGGAVGAGLGWRAGHCQNNAAQVVHGARSSGLGLGSTGDPRGAGVGGRGELTLLLSTPGTGVAFSPQKPGFDPGHGQHW